MTVTMEDIAQAAGVHRSTVSRALANSPRVTPATRQRIQQLAEEMGYVPNAAARDLITRRSRAIGVVLLGLTSPYPCELVTAIDEAALRVGYRVVLSRRSDDAGRALVNIKPLIEQRVEAIVVIETPSVEQYLSLLSHYDVPVILLYSGDSRFCIGTDNVGAAKLGVDHLLDLGHKRIAFIGCSRYTIENDERQTGYTQALLNRGLTPDPHLMVIHDDWLGGEGGRSSMHKLLALPQPPTAVFCWNDETALGALGALGAAGIRVPEDMSLLGFDDMRLARYLHPPLTTIAQPKELLAELTMQTVLSLISGNTATRKEKLPARLVVRGSTAPPKER
jgi:DNA-binding LacI/PurR family transcriptional regulator